jgi:hypothetical protein
MTCWMNGPLAIASIVIAAPRHASRFPRRVRISLVEPHGPRLAESNLER